ncbi:PLxRFG domain-containing protein [Sinorhizobium meliloti]
MPIVIGLDSDVEWSTPDNLLGGSKPAGGPAKTGYGLEPDSAAPAKTETRTAPIDMPERDWNDMVNTVIAEAAGEGDEGMLAVASVIKNRAGVRGKSPGEIVREPDQFTGYAKPGPGALKAMQDPETRKRAESAIMRAFAGGEDPTGGADHYHATSVNPDWAGKMPQTAKVGQHLFYNSKANTGAPRTEAIGLTGEQPRSDAEVPFDALLGREPETTSHVPNPEGKGLARLVRPEQDDDGSLLLSKLQPGKPTSYIENMKPELRTGLSAMFTDAPDHVKSGLDILSGARSPERQAEIIAVNAGKYGLDRNAWLADVAKLGPVEAGKKWRPQFKASGMSKNIGAPGGSRHQHGDAADLGWKGGRFADAPKEVREWVHANAERYGLSFPLGHEPWHIETTTARGGKAGAPIAKEQESPGGIVIDENFTSSNPAFMQEARAIGEQQAAAEAEAAAAAEREKIAARDQADNARIGAAQQALEQKEPGRYQVVDEAELPAWKQRWEEENRSQGLVGDLGRILAAGNARLGLATREAVGMIPGVGPTVVETLDAIDTWVTGKPTEQRLEEYAAKADASVTPRQQEADAKKWWNEANGTFGPAWSDPRSYLRGVGESAPGTIVTMLPGGVLARATYLRMLAGGAEAATAAAAAAKTATIAGAVSEGMLGGAESSRSVRDRLAQIPREQLLQSEAVRDMVEGGMSEADAIKAVTENAATQAFIIAGVTTGAFGGLGDRALAKILAEGVGGNVAQRVLRSAGRGAFAEGVLEELPQGVTQTMSENLAVKRVDPSQSITEGVEEAAAAGVATGGVMGGAMGGAGGAASPAAVDAETAANVSEPVPEPIGPLGRAVQHAQNKAEERAVRALPDVTAPTTASAVPQDGRPEIGATVRVDAEGMDPMLARVESYQGDDAMVVDGGTGEVYQVPIANLSKIAEPVDVQAEALRRAQAEPPVRDVLPEMSSDPALEPAAPIAAETTTEIPPAREQKPATEKRPTRPQPGNRVIVEGSNGERFPARVETYQEDGTEAVVVDDQGKAYQVPVDQLSVSGLTPQQVEEQELERNPPIEHEPADAGPNSRRVGQRTVVLPDEKHAHLYDLAREQLIAKKLGGTSQVDMASVLPAERKRLADEFGISVDDIATVADDYRYRVERASKEAKSNLPVKMHHVNERLLKQRQAARAKQQPETVAAKDEAGQWWDVELTAAGRKQVLEKAGVKRPDRVMWQHLTPNIQKKLLATRDVASPDPAPATPVDVAAHEAATSPSNDLPEPTQAQKEAGNYKVGRAKLGGLDISIENPAGSERKGVSASGKPWSVTMKSHYGYIRGTVGRDKDHIDVFVKPGTDALDGTSKVYVVDQRDPARGRFDEHKVMVGYGSEEEARAAYMENYTSGWKGLGAISETTVDGFKVWLESGKTAEPFAPKWFGSRDKAQAHVAKEKLGATHEVVESGKRFEIREKSANPAKNIQKKFSEPAAQSEINPRALFRSKEWKAAWAGTKFGQPHPESPVAYQMAKGWQDAKAGKEPQRRPVDGTKYRKDGHNPIDDYLMGYVAAREGNGREIRATEAEAVFGGYLAETVDTPAEWELEAEAKAAAKLKTEKAKPSISENKIFTEDAAEKARALLRLKLSGSTLNSGIDPEILQAGITLAGYHIEKGARTFAAFAKAMLADLGDDVRPYLKSWYMGVKYDPRAAAFEGMSSAAEVEAADIVAISAEEGTTEDVSAELDQSRSRALERAPAEQVPGTEAGGASGAGAEGRSRADVSGGGSARATGREARRGVAAGQGDLLAPAGGRSQSGTDEVTEGPFGPILRGYEGKWREAALELERRQTGDAIGALHHPEVGPIDLVWGAPGSNQSNGTGLSKLIAWHPEVLQDLQGFIERLKVDRERSTTRRIQLEDETGRAGVRLDYDGTAKTWLLTAFEKGSRRTERSSRRLSDLWGDRNTASASPRPTENISETLVDVQSAATPAQQRPTNYVITDADELGEGGAKAKFRGNVAAIRLLRKLDEDKRAATREEQSVLAKWVGWGGLRNAFYREDGSVAKGWEKEAAELKALLDSTEYASAESSTRNAHYTSPEVVSAVWDVARRLGFKGGQVLEPSVGAGNFLGLMPGQLRDGAAITGVELDHITGGIAKNLYPGANIQSPMGFEKLTVPNDYFDLAIGNPPFGSEKLYDKQRRHLNKLSIHNFFFAKAIEALRPGGVLAMVVTNRFLDGASAAARDQIAKTSDLVGAIRLPNNAFLKNAGTEVTTDIVILRKRLEGDKPDTSWTKVGEWKGKDGKAVPLNQYFIDKPEMMLGDFGAYGTMYGPDEPALVAREGEDLSEALEKAIRALPQNVMVEPGAAVVPETVNVPETVTDVQVGTAFLAPDGEVHVRMPDHLGQPVSQVLEYPNETAKARVQGMVRVRDAFAKLRRAQIDEKASDAQIENLRKRLNTLYDGFVAKHGPINVDANKRLFRDDPTWPQISALEQGFDKGISPAVAKKTGETAKAPSAQKAAIFTKRTQQPYSRVTSASSAKDALAASLNDFGRINLDAMSFLYGKPADAIVEELGPLVYKTPSGAYETADAYLSGNVKQKLAEAERAAEQDPDFRRNIAALRDVQPADIEAVDIDVKPGAPWVPAKHIEDFAMHITESGARGKAYYSRANAKWAVEVPRPSPAASTLYGTDRAGVETVLMAVLNGQSITIHDRFRDGSTAVNQEATEAANEKAARVKAEWEKWLWQDDARREELVRLYNDTFNTDVLRKYDGSHLTLPGKVSDDIIELRPHQKSFIWRRLQGGTALADHTVGAGKTFAAIASIMEKRRIGQARKPMLVVPNHLVGQWAADFVKLYPGAKVLAATKRDFEKENRKRLFARIATGDWDAVIVAHSSFGRIGMNPEYEARFIQEQMDDLEMSIAELRAETGQKSRNVAQLTKWRDNLKAKMERLLDAGKKDDGLTFDELGVDDLTVDEAHEFKNLAYSTSMQRVAGLGNAAGSQRAADLYMKTQFVLEKTGGNNVAFLTGTPLSNTMAEMYTVQRYLDRKSLTDLGIAHFDAWARVFGEVVTDWELSPSGQYKLNSRFAKFVNVPELMQRYLAFADVVTNDDIKAQMKAMGRTMPLPKVKGGKPTIVVVERSPDQAKYIGEATADDQGNMIYPEGSIVWRAENLPKKQEKGADNMLKVMSDARKAALDMRLVDPGYGDYRGSKVHKAADEMTRIYKKWADQRGTQLVFIDLSTPKKAMATEQAKLRDLIAKAEDGDEAAQEALDKMSPDDFLALQSSFSVYDDLRQKLIDRGIPESEIAFIHDANTEAQKEELFGKVRSGKIRFLFGSTAKMGAGTNVQNRLVGLHHLDAPWRPSDLEQRDGRGIRQGNELYAEDPEGFEIEIMRYATENTLDARQWQTIEAKAKFIEQIRKGDLKKRDIEDIGGEAANAAEMKAAASGNPLILEEMETRRKLQQLERQSSEHDREQHRIKGRIRSLNEEAQSLRNRLPEVEADAQRAQAVEGKPFSATVKGEAFDKHKEFGAAVIAAIRKDLIERAGETEIGEYAGFKISIEHMHSRQYDITLAGDRDYHVNVEDAADMDPTGTAMRIVNTIKGLARIPAADKERIAEIEKQAPALERQIAPWTGQQELDETAARHRRLVDALKPKPKGAAGQTTEVTTDVAAEAEPAKQNKRPDPAVEGAVGNLRSLGAPELKKGIPLRDAAIERVTADGLRTGHEYLLALDDDGSVVEYGTAGDKANTGMNNRLLAAMANPDRKVVVYHNHPSNGPLSSADIGFLAYPGLYSIWAAGHDGQVTRAALTVAAAEALSSETPDLAALSMAKLKNAMIGVEYALQGFLQAQLNSKAITVDQANEAHAAGKLMAADRANVIDFTTNTPYDAAAITGFEAVIDAAADKLAGEIFNGPKNTGKRADRRAEPLRHAAEVARAPVAGKPDAGRRPDTSGLAEASTADYQGKGRGREKRQRVTETRIVEDLRGKLTDLQPAILKSIPLNYFSELARPNMKAVGEYLRVKRIMDAFRGTKHAEADAIGQEWLKYTRLGFVGKDKAKAQALADLMHEATLSGIDPSKVDAETQAMPGYAALRKAYTTLSPKGRELFNKVRDAYRQQTEELDEILLDNVRKALEIALRQAEDRYRRTLQQIKDAGLTGIDKKNAEEDAASAYRAATTKGQWAAKARLTRMRIAFEASRVQGPYFPLGRFGRYFATARDIDGKVLSFSKFETVADRDRAVRQMQKDYPNAKFEVGVMEAGSDLRRAMDPRIVAEIEELLGGSGVSPELMDQVWQRYLESMPDLSARKRFIHRKGTAGFTGDALRVFSSHMFHAAHQMARLKFGLELQELVNQTFDQAKEADDQTRAMTLANELSKRHDWVMNPTGSKVAQTMTSTAFVWFLAASPASALVNMSQTVMLGLPILGARFGGILKAGKALAQASRDSVAGRGSVARANLKEDEKRAIEAFYESGLIDRTQSHDLAGVGETGVEYSPLRAKVMGIISWAFHRAEVWNREVTALAAYRMARAAGQNQSDAIDTAHDLTWKTHFDYSNSSRPALLQNDFAKVALVFRQHNINMLYRMFRDIHQAVKGETPAARREARYQVAGITGMMALMSGVSGVMGYSLAMALAGLIFGDDDDPMAFEQQFRANIVDILGPELGGIVLNGAPGHYLGIDLTSRIGMPDLWFRSPSRELQGKDEYQYWLSQSLGATVSLGEQLYRGFNVITDEGDVARGIEMMAPKAVRDLMKAYRYADEGVTSIRGDEIVPQDEIGIPSIIAQALGFTPAEVAETWERNSALKDAESRIKQKRQRLISRFAMAALAKDKETMAEAIEDIKRFNAVKINAPVAITKETLQRSIKTRASISAKRQDGVLISNEALGKELRDRLADPIYR